MTELKKQSALIFLKARVKIFENFLEVETDFKIKSQLIQKKGLIKKNFLFIHDIGEEFEEQSEFLKSFPVENVISFDLRGHGHSDGERGDFGSFETVINDIKEVLNFYKLKNIEILSFRRSFLFPLFLSLNHGELYNKFISKVHIIDPKILDQKVITRYLSKKKMTDGFIKQLFIFHQEKPIKIESYLSYFHYYSKVTEALYFIEDDIHLHLPQDVRKKVLDVFSLFEDSLINANVVKQIYNSRKELVEYLSEEK